MCVVLVGCQQEVPWRWKHVRYIDEPEQLQSWLCEHNHCTQGRTHQRYPRLHVSMIMLRDDEKEALKMCVVLIAKYLDGLEQLQSWLCDNTHRAQPRNNQCSPHLKASMIILPDGE